MLSMNDTTGGSGISVRVSLSSVPLPRMIVRMSAAFPGLLLLWMTTLRGRSKREVRDGRSIYADAGG
jgi:hypothetical protein